MRRTMYAAACFLAAVVLMPTAALAQPMVELVPEGVVEYIGWRGADDMGEDYAGSHLEGMLEVTGLVEALPELLSAIETFAAEQAPDEELAELVGSITTVASSAWQRGGAMYSLPAGAEEGGMPMPRSVFLVRRGGVDEPELRVAMADIVQAANEADVFPVFMGVMDDALFLSIGFDAAELPEGPLLQDNADFQSAMAQVQDGAALTVYVNGEQWIGQIDTVVQMMRDEAEQWGDDPDPFTEMWPTLREVTGLSGVRQLALTAGIEDKRWETRVYMDAPAPRVGLLSLIDNEPITPEQLTHIPKTATFMQAGTLDPARVMEVSRDILGAVDPGILDELENALEDVSEELGVDLEGQLINGLGPTWTVYVDPMIAGNGMASVVLVNELRDPGRVKTALMRLTEQANGLMEEDLDADGVQVRFLTRQIQGASVVSLGVPFVSPSYMVHDGKLYMAFFPQALEMALEHSGELEDSIFMNEAFGEAMTRVGQGALVGGPQEPGQPGATALSFVDLPETATDGYGLVLMIAQAFGGTSELATGQPAGFQLPPVGKLMPFLEPSAGVAWIDDTGLHARSSEPFPGSSLLGPGKGMESATIIATPIVVGVAMPAMAASRRAAVRMQAVNNARWITMGVRSYAQDNGQAPDDLTALLPDFYIDHQTLISPSSVRAQPLPENFDEWEVDRQMRFHRENSSFVLVPVENLNDLDEPWSTIVVFQRPDDANGWEEGIAVGFADGGAYWESDMEWFAQRLEEQTGMTMDELIERQVEFEPEE